jgi:hypothetical protein
MRSNAAAVANAKPFSPQTRARRTEDLLCASKKTPVRNVLGFLAVVVSGEIARWQPTAVVTRANGRLFSCCKFAPLIHRQPEADQDRQVNTLRNRLHCGVAPYRLGVFAIRYGLNPRSSECLLATLNCSSAGGDPIVAQNKMPRRMAEKNHGGDFAETHWFKRPIDRLHKNSPPIAQRGCASFSVISALRNAI